MSSDRLRRLEALLGRVRERATLGRPAMASDVELIEAPLAPPPPPRRSTPAPAFHVVPPPAAPPAAPAPLVPVPPVRARMESVTLELLDGPLEETLSEEDLVEMSSDVLESVPPAEVTELSSPDPLEEPPASSKRPRSLNAMEEAFSRSTEEDVVLEDGREVPLKTPPPESGPQEAPVPTGLSAPDAQEVDELLEADLLPPVRERTAFESVEPPFGFSSPPSMPGRPTAEQLGQTIDLEEALGPELELDAPPGGPPRATPLLPMLEELEVTLPRGQLGGGGYDESLLPPPQALDELDAHRKKALEPAFEEFSIASVGDEPAAAALATENSSDVAAAEASLEASTSHPEVFERNTLEGIIVQEIVPAAPAPARPTTFAALLDASIALGG